jgi:hypothetical protein
MTAPTNKLDVGAMMTDKIKYFLEAWEMNGVGKTVATVQDRPGTVVTIEVDDLRALLSASKPAVAPEGWKLVPVDPTELMAMAPHTALVKFNPSTVMGHPVMEVARECYRSMLAASPAAPAQSGEPVARVAGTKTLYVDCHECVECGHIGINDSHPTDASCGYSCDWTGPSPVDDKCPGCQREGVMGLACPKCSGRYNILAEAHISYAALQPAQTAQSAVGLDDERAPVIGLLKRARYVRHEDLPADVRDETETRAAYGNSAAWQDARNHEQRRLIDEALSRLEVLATSPQSGQTEQALKAQLNAAYAALDAVADWAKQEGADDDMEAGTRLLALLLKHGVHPRETLAVQPASGGQ